MAKWDKRTIKLSRPHGWHARPGYNVFVADRGAVRFDFPEDWLIVPEENGTIKFHDRQPPDDDCTLAMTVLYLPPGDWSGLSLEMMVDQVIATDKRGVARRGPTRRGERSDLDLAWAEVEFADSTQGDRMARSRTCLARAANVQPLITFDFWESDAAKFGPAWDEILRSLRVAEAILDPTLGQPNRG